MGRGRGLPVRLAIGCLVAATVAVLGVGTAGAAQVSPAVHPYRVTTASQAVVITAPDWGTSTALLSTYTWTDRGWKRELGPVTAYIGTNGFTATPQEADDYTPVGQYSFLFAFGSDANPGTAMPYLHATDDDHWVDDPGSAYYNTYEHGDGSGRWSSAETLSNYTSALAFDFNQNQVVRGANSAIFLHGGDEPTPGCIAIDDGDLAAIMRWLNPTAHPTILLGVNIGPPVHPMPATTTTAAPTRVKAAAAGTPGSAPSTTATPPSTTTTVVVPSTVPPTPVSTPASAIGVSSASSWPIEAFAAAMAVLAIVPGIRRRRMMRE